ncbi:MAG TPA: hypothetical protein VFG42_04520 [Baekduia sp.]|uniref:hypothetical protein n=1 Tax=Baekduia sp. TaxID=2600305 RepID=UPI002D7737FA|nr:hypothetical protein [Baekduia sp.]HET6506030.1 hypothetical protein [Baekduia sp.]
MKNAALFMILLTAMLVGCGDGNTTAHPATASAPAPRPAATKPRSDGDAELTRKVKKAMRENYGIPGMKADWYDDIEGITVKSGLIGTYVYVATGYYDDSDVADYARRMCISFTSIIVPDLQKQIDGTRIQGANGADITSCAPGQAPS